MYLLDTNIISEMRKIKKGRAHPRVTAWLAEQNPHDLYVNTVIVMEIERGILAMERKDRRQAESLRAWQQAFFNDFLSTPVLPVTDKTARICARLHIPDHAPENDAWIAASAIEHHLVLATRNTADFARTGAKLFNPFEEGRYPADRGLPHRLKSKHFALCF